MRNMLCLTLLMVFVGVAQAQNSEQVASCDSRTPESQPVYLDSADGMKLYFSEFASGSSYSGAQVIPSMRRSGTKKAWARVQVLVDQQGRVQGVQNIEGTPAVLKAVVREVQRYKLKPYIVDGCAVPFVTVLKLRFGIEEPACSLKNRSGCR